MPGRPDSCPDCGASCRAHTGSYCQECGTPLVVESKLTTSQQRALELIQRNDSTVVMLGLRPTDRVYGLVVRGPDQYEEIEHRTLLALERRGLVTIDRRLGVPSYKVTAS